MRTKRIPVGQLIREAVGEVDDALFQIDPFLSYIGEVVVWFNALEADLDEVICNLISDRSASTGLLIMANTMFQTKLDLFERLSSDWLRAKELEPPWFKTLISDLKSCGAMRNKVVHANWLHTNSEGYTEVKIKARNDGIIEHEMAQFSVQSLEQIIEKIGECRNKLSELACDYLPL